jgi:hypothetical protein
MPPTPTTAMTPQQLKSQHNGSIKYSVHYHVPDDFTQKYDEDYDPQRFSW